MSLISNTSVYGVIGDPIEQSMSPDIHNFWLKSLNIDAFYNKFHLQTDVATQDIESLYRFGVKGLNVTMPYKEQAFSAAVNVSENAKIIGVANTLIAEKNGWRADNTDAYGFFNALMARTANIDLENRNILLIGAGGAARAVAYILDKRGAKLTIANRTIKKADALIADLAPNGQSSDLGNLAEKMDASDIVLNAISLKAGLGDSILFPTGKGRLFFDLSYGEAPKTILSNAQNHGWETEDGLRMLVEQAALSFELWFNKKPDVESALNLCREKIA